MRRGKGLSSFRVVFVLCALGPFAQASPGDIYVDDSHSGPFLGTSTNPFKTIHDAIFSPAGSGDSIHVASGTYNAVLGEVFPIEIPNGVTLEGPPSGTLSIVGGDLIDEVVSADALVVIDAWSSDRTGIVIRRLRFMGENETSLDSPISLKVLVGTDKTVDFVFEDNVCGRPHQNDSGIAGLPTISVSALSATVTGAIRGNVIEASNRGGIEVVDSVTSGKSLSLNGFSIDDNYITNPGGAVADWGINWLNVDSAATTFTMNGIYSISGNTVRGRGNALRTGIQILCEEHIDPGHGPLMRENQVDGCAEDGITFGANGWEEEDEPEFVVDISGSLIRDNGGSGIVYLWDSDADAEGAGYIHVGGQGVLIADNGGYAARFEGFGSMSRGSYLLINATIVNNGLGALGFENLQLSGDPVEDFQNGMSWAHANCIVYGNGNSEESQIVGLDGLDSEDEEDVRAILLSLVSYCDWEGVPLEQLDPCTPEAPNFNIDCAPLFVTPGRPYHLDDDPQSPCIDLGNNLNGLVPLDIDGEDRIQDGDFPCSGDPDPIVDMGYDELQQPDC